jgi:hypothetical protein
MNIIAFIILCAVLAVVSMVIHRGFATAKPWRAGGLISAANAYDGATGTHPGNIRRTVDVAFTDRHLLAKQGAGAGTVALCGVADIPLGPIDNILAINEPGEVQLLGRQDTKLFIASEPIAAGDEIFAAASGKVQNRPVAAGTYYYIGVALTSAVADGDVIEVNDGHPLKVVI